MRKYPFGNDPSKLEGYTAFWDRTNSERPLIGFTLISWFPLESFTACKSWEVGSHITTEMIRPEEWLEDTEKLLKEGEIIKDDIIRGACPTQLAFPVFLFASLGCGIRVVKNTVLPEAQHFSWEDALNVRLDKEHPWFRKYVEFTEALVEKSQRRYPISHSGEAGPTDLQAVIRGHNESLLDLIDYPEETKELIFRLGNIFVEATRAIWEHIPLFHGGFFDAQYQLWAPGPIIRIQEDATASFSPDTYRSLVQPVDKMMAEQFSYPFMHLHTTSMYLLDAFLEIEAMRCFEINVEPFNIPLRDMFPFYRKVQDANRSLIIRGSFTPDELKMVLDELDPRGLYIHIIIANMDEVEPLSLIAGL